MIEHYQQKFKKDVIRIFNEYPLMFDPADINDLITNELNEHRPNHLRFIYVEEKILKGFISAQKAYDTKEYWKINYLVVDKKFENQGIGSALIKHMEKEIKSKGIDYIILDTSHAKNPTSEAAMHFYKKHGYKKAGELPNYWGKGDSEVTFIKKL